MNALIILGLIDVIGGVVATFNIHSGIAFVFGIMLLLKGLWSVIASISAGFYFEIMGGIDIAGGIVLILISRGIFSELFVYLGVLLAAKGVYSLIFGYTGR